MCPGVQCASGARRCPQRSEEDTRCSGTGIIVEIATGVPRTEPVSSTRAVNEFSCWVIPPTLSDICFLRKTPWLMTLLSCLLHSSPMRHIVLSVASVPSLRTPVFLFSRPHCPTDSPHESHPLPHHSWKEYFPVSAYVCTKLLQFFYRTWFPPLLSCPSLGPVCELFYVLLRQPRPVLGTHSEHKFFHIPIKHLFLSDLKLQTQIYHCTPQRMSPVLCTHWTLQLDGWG